MKSHRRTFRRLRALALGLAAIAALAPAGALAQPTRDVGASGSQFKIGDTPADFAQPVTPAPKSGDTPADYPGISDASGAGTIADSGRTLTEATDTGGFDWVSAAIGAGGAGVLIVVSLGGMTLASRRRIRVAR